jgi:hypothetical protein
MPIAVNKHKGFKIYMNFNKIQNYYYPHFEVEYKGTVAKFAIDLSIIELSDLPVNIANEVIDWAFDNYDELLKLWTKLINNQKALVRNNYSVQVNKHYSFNYSTN